MNRFFLQAALLFTRNYALPHPSPGCLRAEAYSFRVLTYIRRALAVLWPGLLDSEDLASS